MTLICPTSYTITEQEYTTSISQLVGEVKTLNLMVCSDFKNESPQTAQPILQQVIEKIQKIKLKIDLDLLTLDKSHCLCCYANNQKIFSTILSLLDTGVTALGAAIAYTDEDTVSNTVGVVCIIAGQFLSKYNDVLLERSEQMLRRKTVLKDHLLTCGLLHHTASEAYELCLTLEKDVKDVNEH